MDELFDRVNEKDEVIGTTTKKEAHEKGYIHRVAAVFVFNGEGEMLVQHRKKDGLLDHSVGGHLRVGESYDAAASREFHEELGLSGKLTKIGNFYSDERSPQRFYTIIHRFGLYEIKINEKELKKMSLSDNEVLGMIPMSLQEIAKLMIAEPMKWTVGSMQTLNFYAKQKGLNLPIVPIK